MTHTTQIRGIFDIANSLQYHLNLLQCFSNGPMHTASFFCYKFTAVVILSLSYPFNHMIFCAILCCNWLKLLYVSLFV